MELRLYLKYGSRRATILGCGRRAKDAGRFIVRSDDKLTAFLELEPLIRRAQSIKSNQVVSPKRL